MENTLEKLIAYFEQQVLLQNDRGLKVSSKEAYRDAVEVCKNALAAIKLEDDDEPYFGWCDVDGCENESGNNGTCWRETGYWKMCYKHSAQHRAGEPQPKMKQTSIEREAKRDKVTGYLLEE